MHQAERERERDGDWLYTSDVRSGGLGEILTTVNTAVTCQS